MNKRIDLTNLGGFPLEQDTLNYMQSSYDAAFQAVAMLCGNKTILSGVVNTAGVVSDGWISYNNELLPFIGGALGVQVVIQETPAADQTTFQDGTKHDIYFTKVATCGAVGSFPFSDLVPLLSLQNMWRPGDIKDRYLDPATASAYIAANFDSNGFGVNAETGWRILSKAVPLTAGKTFVNVDFGDPDFATLGTAVGEKEHVLSPTEFSHKVSIPRGDAYTGNSQESSLKVGGGQGTSPQSPVVITIGNSSGISDGHNNIQPSYIILKLIKL
jgi:hypothetical protein